MKQSILISFFLSICCLQAMGQRYVSGLNNEWTFIKEGDTLNINLPHTYNSQDAFDDPRGYYRGEVIYKQMLKSANFDQSKKHFIRFGAVNQEAKVYLNGNLVGSHLGGYTSFTIDLTNHLNYKSDLLEVVVTNEHNKNIPPLRGDFTFYGGIYRDVQLISVDHTHFSLNHYGSDGIFIDPIEVRNERTRIGVRGYVDGLNTEKHTVNVYLYERSGQLLRKMTPSTYNINDGQWSLLFNINNPHLWTTEDPYLYTFVSEIVEKSSGKLIDRISIPYGFRFYNFDPDKGFFLNGEYKKLIGVNRHQDRHDIGNALKAEHHIADMELINEMGANYLRTAHYPQDKLITEYCDRQGILVSIEIPLDHEITQSQDFADNSKLMTLEMIYQYYNHPSVIIWAYMNEMGLGKQIVRDSTIMWDVAKLAQELEELIRKEDPYRYTMIPNHGDFDIYKHFGLTDIPMLVGWNLYYGWYEPDFDGFGKFVDHAHAMVPDKPILITEYGAGADPRITSYAPERFDFSQDWSIDFHASHIKQIKERDFIAGSAVWNMFDFGSESRQDAVPHINNKGLCGIDRKPKPVFYLYQSQLRKDLDVIIPDDKPKPLSEFEDYWANQDILNINFGTNFYFTPDDVAGTWYPSETLSKQYMTANGGKRFSVRDRGIGSDRGIDLTDLDPIYQTQLLDVESLTFPVPLGDYQIIIHISRLLKNTDFNEKIMLNGQSLSIGDLDPWTAYTYTFFVEHSDLLKLDFTPIEGSSTFINGIQIIKK